MISPWISIGLAFFCGMIGAAVRVFDFTPRQKKVVGWSCIGEALFGLCITGYGFFVASVPEAATRMPATIAQDHPMNSPNVIGDGNTVSIGPDTNATPKGE